MAGDPSAVVFRRFAAALLDYVIVGALYLGGVSLVGVDLVADPTNPGGYRWEGDTTSVAWFFFLTTGYWVLTAVVCQGLLGWTPGKLIWGIRLVGWDGRPPGLARAFAHAIVVSLAIGVFGCLGAVVLLAFVAFNKVHRHPGDMLGGTYVVDAWSMGRVMIRTSQGLQAGPPAVTRSDVVDAFGAERAAAILAEPDVGGRPTQPVYDKQRDTYVVWRPKQEQWMEFDKASNAWRPLT